MNRILARTVQKLRTVQRSIAATSPERPTTASTLADHRTPASTADRPPETNLVLLAALVLGGLMDPAVAAAIAALDANQNRGSEPSR